MDEAAKLLALLLLHLVLTALPGIAATLLAARLGLREVPVLLAIALAATAAVAMLVFWAYYGTHELGQTASFLAVFGSILLAGGSLWGGGIDRELLRALAVPLGLWALGSAFLVMLGFLHGGAESPISNPALRFSHQLPSDNDLPNYFGGWFYEHGHHGTPPTYPPSWNASERPPLQMGFLVAQRPFGTDSAGLNYQLLGVVLQQLWIVGLWALLLAARVGRVTRALIMVTVLVSAVAIVNGFYVWPKMLPTALLLAAAALVVTPLWQRLRRSLWGAALIAALLALAMLAHGGAVFGVIPVVILAAWRGLPSWRWIGVGVLVGVVLMAPWSAYQKWGDPPGNRLTKWMLAGDNGINDRGTLEVVTEAYGDAGVGGTISNKAENFGAMLGANGMPKEISAAFDGLKAGDMKTFAGEIRAIFFYHLIPSLGLLLLGPLAMLAARRRGRLRATEWDFGIDCFLLVGIGALAWGLLLFGNYESRAVLHQGSYLLPLLGLCGAVAGLRATFPRFGLWFAAANAALMLALYVPSLEPPPETAYSFWAALFAAAGLAGFVLLTWLSDRPALPGSPARAGTRAGALRPVGPSGG